MMEGFLERREAILPKKEVLLLRGEIEGGSDLAFTVFRVRTTSRASELLLFAVAV